MLHVRRSLQLHPQKIVAGRKAVSNRFRFSVSQGWEKILVKATGTLALSNFDIYYTFYFLYIPINLFLCTCYINYSYEPLLLKLRYKQIIEKLIVTRIMKKHNLNQFKNYYVPGPGASLLQFIGGRLVPQKLATQLDFIRESKQLPERFMVNLFL